MIKYLGSKRLLIPAIVEVVQDMLPSGTVLDLFSGTSRVGHALKEADYRVVSNDVNQYAATLARCYVECDHEALAEQAQRWINKLQDTTPKAGWFTETYCEQSRFFKPENGAHIEAIRNAIAEADLEPQLKAVLLVSLMEAADRVDSTTGLQMAYLKSWAPRASNALQLRLPKLLPQPTHGACEAWCSEAVDAAARFRGDLAYLDPPYNQHSYLGNYHIWETLVRWDQPEVYGVACKRIDCRERRSAFNSRPAFAGAFREVVEALAGKQLLVSFSDEGYLQRSQLEEILGAHGKVSVIERDHPRYVGARIGIHNPQGKRVGKVSHVRNREFLFKVQP
ncbi:MAG: DNA methyltransferase [Planctomycetes bacterium]|nr:DNA methyltransferase [Planctomycetota bacterium]MCP4772339.1 DNA methyltransferase [Planctomycetota bacterium]MCP4861561.1 DNA methyltransferase [Planctomycetota bacterium]